MKTPDREPVDELEKALHFFSLLANSPFVCLVFDTDAGAYHLFTKGDTRYVEELMDVMRNA